MKPFRWNLKKREQLGSLLNNYKSESDLYYIDDIRECAAKVLARSDNRRLIFVGRSPENIFDYLSGVLQHTSWEEKLEHLNISNRAREIDDIAKKNPDSYMALKEHFRALGISPNQLIECKLGVCFVDLVYEGFTFERLFEFYSRWCEEERLDTASVWKKIRFLGITSRKKNSPNTWRWYQEADWLLNNPYITGQSIAIDRFFWSYMGDYQSKTINPNRPKDWSDESILIPPRDEKRLEALGLAYAFYSYGLNDKLKFCKDLAKLQGCKESWIRSLSLEIKNS